MTKREIVWRWAMTLDTPITAVMVRQQFDMKPQSASHILIEMLRIDCLYLVDSVPSRGGLMNRYRPTDKCPPGYGKYDHRGARRFFDGMRVRVLDDGLSARKAKINAPKAIQRAARRLECKPVVRLG